MKWPLWRDKAEGGGAPPGGGNGAPSGRVEVRGAWGRLEAGGPGVESWVVLAGPGEGFRFPPGRVGLLAASALAGRVVEMDGAEIVGGLGVLGEVDAGRLVLGGNPEAHGLIDDLAEDPGHREGVQPDRD